MALNVQAVMYMAINLARLPSLNDYILPIRDSFISYICESFKKCFIQSKISNLSYVYNFVYTFY